MSPQANQLTHRLERWLTQIWYENRKPGLAVLPLKLLEYTYAQLRNLSGQDEKVYKAKTAQLEPPVLIIGNLIAGGAGKTPIVKAVCDEMTARGKRVGILSRGYKRSSKGDPIRYIGPDSIIDAREVGDEPAWLAKETGCPICIGSDRAATLALIKQKHPNLDLIVSDDGLQHHRLPRSLEWVVFDSRAAGNGRLLPAGPLREPLSRLNSSDAILSGQLSVTELSSRLGIAPDDRWHSIKITLSGFTNPATSESCSVEEMQTLIDNHSSLAFTGLANPAKFFDMLQAHKIKPKSTLGLPDHFAYPVTFLDSLDAEVLLATGKDAVKLPTNNAKLWIANLTVALPDPLMEQIHRVC